MYFRDFIGILTVACFVGLAVRLGVLTFSAMARMQQLEDSGYTPPPRSKSNKEYIRNCPDKELREKLQAIRQCKTAIWILMAWYLVYGGWRNAHGY